MFSINNTSDINAKEIRAIKFYRIKLKKYQTIHYAVKQDEQYQLVTGSIFDQWQLMDQFVAEHDAVLLPPVTPTKIVAIGLNYKSHAQEMGMALPTEPLMFLKPLSSLNACYENVVLPRLSQQVEYEGELAIIIKRQCKFVKENEVDDVIAGYTLANDVTARDLQKKDGQWTRAKGFDTFCPLGPCLTTEVNPEDLEFQTFLNGELKQIGKIADLIFNIPRIVASVSDVMTLYPGDVILTGTPPGIGPIKAGDKVTIRSTHIGMLENQFVVSDFSN